jgi:hypothetical protein
LIVSGSGCSQTLSFLLSKIKNFIGKINNLGQQEEGEIELIFLDNPTAMTATDMELYLYCMITLVKEKLSLS